MSEDNKKDTEKSESISSQIENLQNTNPVPITKSDDEPPKK